MNEQLEFVSKRLAELGINAQEGSDSEITVRGVHEEVGDIVIRSESGELIVSIGRHFHTHFSIDGGSKEQTAGLVEFVSDFVNCRSVLTVQYSGSRLICARVAIPETGLSWTVIFPVQNPGLFARVLAVLVRQRETTRSFKWSGEIFNSNLHAMNDRDDESDLARKLAGLNADEMKALGDYLSQRAKESKDGPE